MRSKAQFESRRGSVDNYVTKRLWGWNAAHRACRFSLRKRILESSLAMRPENGVLNLMTLFIQKNKFRDFEGD